MATPDHCPEIRVTGATVKTESAVVAQTVLFLSS